MPDYAGLISGLLENVAAPQLDSLMTDAVMWQHCTGDDGAGGDQFDPAVPVRPLLDRTVTIEYTAGGGTKTIVATLTFVPPLTAVDPRDIFTLPDGTTAPVVSAGGFTNPQTGQAFVTEVKLGVVKRGE